MRSKEAGAARRSRKRKTSMDQRRAAGEAR